ncbi:General vesicular transport factor [Smittium culicis]|uniref:General vesicular transport factor n=1 Tax=Smittium culicis TaxID=133412 RepID=A0A1R1Y191_9FUNG|nr:General vesicular transport factor [Smittium culicis]
MNFISKGYSALVGEGKNLQQTPELTIQKLTDRVSASTLIEDRRAAVLGLKGLAKEYKRIVGEEALDPLLSLLQEEYEDPSLIKSILETINNLITTEEYDNPKEISLWHAKVIVENDDHIARLLALIGDSDFYIKFNALQQLGILFAHSGEVLISKILVSPVGVGKLVDLLSDTTEIIRNEGVQLLILMTEKNSEIQKILAFENTFEILFSIIIEEGGVGGNIIVQDCLQLLYNLLGLNISNQKYFRETSCIQRLPDLLFFDPSENDITGYGTQDSGWKDQHARNILVVLEIVRMLVQNGNTDTFINQKSMQTCGMVSPLLQHALSLEAPSTVRAQSLAAVGDIIRSNSENQNIFQRILISASPDYDDHDHDHEGASATPVKVLPEPAILVISRIAVGSCPPELSEESYHLVRSAATYLIRCYLENNPDAQLAISATFNPPPTDDILEGNESQQSVGSLLVSVMTLPVKQPTISDTLRICNALSLFSLLVHLNEDCKMLALKVIVEKYNGSDCELVLALLRQAVSISKNLSPNSEAQDSSQSVLLCSQYLSTLSLWLYNCPPCVACLLKDKDASNFLIENISRPVSKGFLLQGISSFLFGVVYEFNSEPNTSVKNSDLYLILNKRLGVDHLLLNLTKLYDSNEIYNAFSKDSFDSSNQKLDLDTLKIGYSFAVLFRSHINQLKLTIRKNPESIEAYSSPVVNSPKTFIPEENSKQENKSNKKKSSKKTSNETSEETVSKSKYDELNALLLAKNNELSTTLEKLENMSVSNKKNKNKNNNSNNDNSKFDDLNKEISELKKLNSDLEKKLELSNSEIEKLNNQISEDKNKFTTLESNFSEKEKTLAEKLSSANTKISSLEEQISILSAENQTKKSSDPGIKDLEDKIIELEKEQEDLLVLLADQDASCKSYRKQLREKGVDIPPSDVDDDDEDLEE